MGKPAILLSSVSWPRESKIELEEPVRILRFDLVEGGVLNVLAALLNDSEVDNNAIEIKRKSLDNYNYPISMILLFSDIRLEKRRISNHRRMCPTNPNHKNLIKQLRLPNSDKLCMKPGSINLLESFSHFSWPSRGQLFKIVWKKCKVSLYGELRERVRWTKFCTIIGYPSGKDGAYLSYRSGLHALSRPNIVFFVHIRNPFRSTRCVCCVFIDPLDSVSVHKHAKKK